MFRAHLHFLVISTGFYIDFIRILPSPNVYIIQQTICFSNLDHSLVFSVTIPDAVLIHSYS